MKSEFRQNYDLLPLRENVFIQAALYLEKTELHLYIFPTDLFCFLFLLLMGLKNLELG